jgi:hypothetical protein
MMQIACVPPKYGYLRDTQPLLSDSFEEAGKAAAECKRFFFYSTVWLLTHCNPVSRNRKAQINLSTLCFCRSSSIDHSLSSPRSWSGKEENNSDKT